MTMLYKPIWAAFKPSVILFYRMVDRESAEMDDDKPQSSACNHQPTGGLNIISYPLYVYALLIAEITILVG